MPYHMRVATFWQARLAPITDVNIASRASHHRLPQNRCDEHQRRELLGRDQVVQVAVVPTR